MDQSLLFQRKEKHICLSKKKSKLINESTEPSKFKARPNVFDIYSKRSLKVALREKGKQRGGGRPHVTPLLWS